MDNNIHASDFNKSDDETNKHRNLWLHRYFTHTELHPRGGIFFLLQGTLTLRGPKPSNIYSTYPKISIIKTFLISWVQSYG